MMNNRCGVSLLEVLISIGVLAIGLFGVIALIPVATQQAEEGARKDAMSIAGRRAVREFHARGYGAVESWLPPLNPGNVTTAGYFGNVFQNPIGIPEFNPQLRAFCLDPVGYALNDAVSGSATLLSNLDVYSFPADAYNLGTQYMPRLRLRSAPGSGYGMWAAQVEEVFRFQDDLEFELPEKSSENPLSTPLRTIVDSVNTPIKRYAKGRFSWFATLVPPPSTNGGYQLSIAIVQDRNAWLPATTSNVSAFVTFDGSGELILDTPVELKPGQWFMVMNGVAGLMVDPGTNVPRQYEWYQVVSVNGANISVNGPAWNLDPATSGVPAVAVVVPKVVAVYSKTLPLTLTVN